MNCYDNQIHETYQLSYRCVVDGDLYTTDIPFKYCPRCGGFFKVTLQEVK